MQISSHQAGRSQPAQPIDNAPRTQSLLPGERDGVRRTEDRVDLRDDPKRSAADRLQAFADKLHERLARFAEQTGLDVGEIERTLDQHVARLQAGLEDGSLDPSEVAQGLAAVVDDLQGDLRALRGEGTDQGARDASLGGEDRGGRVDADDVRVETARVENAVAHIEERVAALAAHAEGAAAEGLEQALAAFGENADRLLGAIANGSLEGDAIAQGVQGLIDLVQNDVGRVLDQARATREGDDSGLDAGNATERRFDAFTARVDERLGDLAAGLDPEQREAVGALQAGFEQAMGRLGNAYFEGGISHDEFQTLLTSLYDQLSADVQGLFGQARGSDASLYHPVTGLETLGGSVPGGIDRTV